MHPGKLLARALIPLMFMTMAVNSAPDLLRDWAQHLID